MNERYSLQLIVYQNYFSQKTTFQQALKYVYNSIYSQESTKGEYQ